MLFAHGQGAEVLHARNTPAFSDKACVVHFAILICWSKSGCFRISPFLLKQPNNVGGACQTVVAAILARPSDALALKEIVG
jgi:hypothetical protein